MNRLRNFLSGRRGTDQLSFFLVCVWFVIQISAVLSGVSWLMLVALPWLVIAFCRMLSRNIRARAAENDRFLHMFSPISRAFSASRARRKDNTHRYFRCRGCGAMLRVPCGVGKIVLTCPKCGRKRSARA